MRYNLDKNIVNRNQSNFGKAFAEKLATKTNKKEKMGKKAWIITKEWTGDHAKEDDVIVMFLHPNTGEKKVKEIVEVLYAALYYTHEEKLDSVTTNGHNPYKAEYGAINGIQWMGGIFCGHNPWFFARRVMDIETRYDESENPETTWKEIPKAKKINLGKNLFY